VIVGMELPMGTPAFKKDDVVQSINGQAIASLEDFRAAYEALAVGDDVALVVMRDSDEVSATRAKANSDGMIRMRSSN
jgi:S1-C subfamily serine protease